MVWIRCGFEQNLLWSDSAIFLSSQPNQREGPKMGFLCLEVCVCRGGMDYGTGWMRSVCGCDVTAVCPCQLENKSLKKRGDNTATVFLFFCFFLQEMLDISRLPSSATSFSSQDVVFPRRLILADANGPPRWKLFKRLFRDKYHKISHPVFNLSL